MNSRTSRWISIVVHRTWMVLLLIASATIPGLAICTYASEIQIVYSPTTTVSKLPLWSKQEIIVKFGNDVTEEYRNVIIREHGCLVVDRCLFSNLQLVQIPESLTAAETVDIFEKEPAVDYAELNYYAQIALVPDDTFYLYQWHLNGGISGGIGTEAAWDIQTGDPNVIVAVLDTGIAYEDFGAYKQAPDLVGTSFVAGYDFVNNDSHANDDQGHGTHVTGTIAKSTNNGIGVAGVAFGCSIMPVKVISRQGTGTYFDIARGIYFATSNGAKVINMSLGGEADSITLREAVSGAYSRGVTIVCAAGNQFLENNASVYPAAYDDYCIAVGAIRYDETRSYYSNTGHYLGIVAPGGDMLVDQNGDGYPDRILQQTFGMDPNVFAYWFLQGTSMAAPHVSGTAALLISNGVTDPDKVREAIEKTAKDIGPNGWDEEHGWGLINIPAALNYGIGSDLNL